jgi:zinc protease
MTSTNSNISLFNGDAIPSVPPGVRMATLENGLTIIVREDHSAPVVSAQAWCMAGSIHEGKWLGGRVVACAGAYVVQGDNDAAGQPDRPGSAEAGGYMNAYTSFDRTVYHIDVPNTGGRVAVDILCDIMQHATLPTDELDKEKQVIVREMDMNLDDPGRPREPPFVRDGLYEKPIPFLRSLGIRTFSTKV